jgi:PKD repeat protein
MQQAVYFSMGGPTKAGFELYNKTHFGMKGSPIIKGEPALSSLQAGLVIPNYDSSNLYYLFYNANTERQDTNQAGGLYYAVIDMNGDNGLGEVISSRSEIPVTGTSFDLYDPNGAVKTEEGLTAIPHCNGKDHWLLTHDPRHYYMHVFLVTDDSVVHRHHFNVGLSSDLHAITASRGGSLVHIGDQVLNFDRATGQLSKRITLLHKSIQGAFSSNSQVLYYSNGNTIYQVDLFSNPLKTRVIGQGVQSTNIMMLGPDERIYTGEFNSENIGVINFPNNININNNNECGYNGNGVKLSASNSGLPRMLVGLPNMLVAEHIDALPIDFGYTLENCTKVQFETYQCCAANYFWNFGDGTTSTDKSPEHQYAQKGTYSVLLVADGDSITKQVRVDVYKTDLSGPTEICDTGINYTYSITPVLPEQEYIWSISPATNDIINNQIGFVETHIKDSGSIEVIVINDNGCRDTIQYTFSTFPALTGTGLLTGPAYCAADDTVKIIGQIPDDANRSYTFKWYSSNTDSFSMIPLHSDTTKDLFVLKDSAAKFYLREVILDNCVGKSSVQEITYSPDIWYNNPHHNQIKVCNPSDTIIECTTPLGGNGVYTYQWYKQQNYSNFVDIPGETSPSLIPQEGGKYFRKVYSGGCEHEGGQVEVTTPTIENTIQTAQCLYGRIGDSTHIRGNKVNSETGYTTQYAWESSTDNSTWTSLTNTTQNLSTIQSQEKMWYRRTVTHKQHGFTVCSKVSRALLIQPFLDTIYSPVNDTICNSASSIWNFNVNMKFNTDVNFSLGLEYKNSNPSDPTWYRVNNLHSWGHSMQADNYMNSDNNAHLDSVRFVIITDCDSFYSDIAVIHAISNTPGFTQHPTDKTLIHKSSGTLTGTIVGNYSTNYYWQMRELGSSLWNTFDTTNSNTLLVFSDPCIDSAQFRLVATNVCGSSFSSPARVIVRDFSDLWMMDSQKDTGAEPNGFTSKGTITEDIYRSPDLWNCKNSGSCLNHEFAEYKLSGHNYVRTKIRNRGSDTSEPENLFLYWTLASTGEYWDHSWKASPSNRFFNEDSVNLFPLGSEINDTPIVIPRLAPGDSIIITHPWSPPNPIWYYTYVNGVKVHMDTLVTCLLARVEKCENYPHKMTIDEVFNIKVEKNVINNNNIVTRNLGVIDQVPGSPTKKRIWGSMRNLKGYTSPIDFELEPKDPSHLTQFTTEVRLDDSLWDAWMDGGGLGNDYVLSGTNTVKVTGTDFVLTGILLDSSQMGFYELIFTPIYPEITIPGTYTYYSRQYSSGDTMPDGGIIIDMTVPPPPAEPFREENDENEYQEEEEIEWVLLPNPSNNKVAIEIDFPQTTMAELSIHDYLGREIVSFGRARYKKGTQTLHFDVSTWAQGTYFVYLKFDHTQSTKLFMVK